MESDRRKFTGEMGKLVNVATAALIEKRFEYRRVGFDSRFMTFDPAGYVAEGADRCETCWKFNLDDGPLSLEIYGEEGNLTCRLRQYADGIWRGRWEEHERMPVELAPLPSPFLSGGNPREAIQRTIDDFSKRTKNVFFVQIGAHDGISGDPIHPWIERDRWSGILVEPVRHLFEKLRENYRNRVDLIFENCAISDKSEVRTLYRVKETDEPLPDWYDQLGSFFREVVLKHREAIPQLESRIIEEKVHCLTLAALFEKHNVQRVDFLHVDAEGFDFQILKQIDFGQFRPALILFEHKHLSSVDQVEVRKFLRRKDCEMLQDPDSGDTLAARSLRKPKAVMIQQASGEYRELLRATHAWHSAYAERRGMDFWSIEGDVQTDRPPHWNKIILVQRALELDYELIVWLDADALIVKTDCDLREAMAEFHCVGMCRHPGQWGGDPWHFNTGVMFIRNGETARAFFSEVWLAGPVNHPWQEQVRILECARRMPAVVQMIDNKWNTTEGRNPSPWPIIKAWHGRGPACLEAMRAECKRLRSATA